MTNVSAGSYWIVLAVLSFILEHVTKPLVLLYHKQNSWAHIGTSEQFRHELRSFVLRNVSPAENSHIVAPA